MTVPAVLTRRARADLAAAIRWIAVENAGAAQRLNDALVEAARRIGANPAIGARRPQLAPDRYRFWPLRRFGYLIVYTDQTAPPRIVRIVHMARDLPVILADLQT